MQKKGSEYKTLSAFHCGKKYCSICSSRKRNKLTFRYLSFFESEEGKQILEKYDLALFTVTLQHNKTNLRTDPYYKELSEHWRNGLKYGSFKKYLSGGFYNVEHTYTDNGHHIHRHALVLIEKKHNLYEGGEFIDPKTGTAHESKTINSEKIQEELRAQWLKRTDGSFQIDLTPFYQKKKTKEGFRLVELKENLMEVTKYITKRDDQGIINPEIVLAVEDNNRATFYHKFGILYRVKALNMNQINEEQNAEEETVKEKAGERLIKELNESKERVELVICSRLQMKTRKEGKRKIPLSFSFAEESQTFLNADLFTNFRNLISNAKFKWRLEQMDRYDKGIFYDKWKEMREFRERFGKEEQQRKEKEVNRRSVETMDF